MIPEQTIPSGPDQHDGDRAVQDAVEDLVRAKTFDAEQGVDGVASDADGAHQRGGDQEAPNDQVAEKEPLRRFAEVIHASLQQRVAGGKLPTGKPLVEHELEKGPQHHRPENRQAQFVAGEGGRAEVPRPDARRRDQDAGSDDRQDVS